MSPVDLKQQQLEKKILEIEEYRKKYLAASASVHEEERQKTYESKSHSKYN